MAHSSNLTPAGYHWLQHWRLWVHRIANIAVRHDLAGSTQLPARFKGQASMSSWQALMHLVDRKRARMTKVRAQDESTRQAALLLSCCWAKAARNAVRTQWPRTAAYVKFTRCKSRQAGSRMYRDVSSISSPNRITKSSSGCLLGNLAQSRS